MSTDIIHKNQHIVNSDGTAIELARCVSACKRTALVCAPWDQPTSLERIWCLYEVHHTLLAASTELVPCYNGRENERMIGSKGVLIGKAQRDKIVDRFSKAVTRIKVEDAGATVLSDKEAILDQLRKARGGDLSNTDTAIQMSVAQALTRSFLGASGNEQTERYTKIWITRPVITFWCCSLFIGILFLLGSAANNSSSIANQYPYNYAYDDTPAGSPYPPPSPMMPPPPPYPPRPPATAPSTDMSPTTLFGIVIAGGCMILIGPIIFGGFWLGKEPDRRRTKTMKGFIRSLQNHYAGKPDVVRQIQKIYNGVEEEEKNREESGKEAISWGCAGRRAAEGCVCLEGGKKRRARGECEREARV